MRGTTSPSARPWPRVSLDVKDLLDPTPWTRLYERVNPYGEQWREELLGLGQQLAARTWAKVCAAFPPGTPGHVVARNAWALTKRLDPSLIVRLEAILSLAASQEKGVANVLVDLQKDCASSKTSPDTHWIGVLLGREGIDENGRGVRGIAAHAALSYALANALRQQETQASDVFRIVDMHPAASRWAVGRSIRVFLSHTSIVALPASEVAGLSLRSRLLLLEQPDLKSTLLGVTKQSVPPALRIARKQWAVYRQLSAIMRSVVPTLRRRDLVRANQLSERILRLPWTPGFAPHLTERLIGAVRSPALGPKPPKPDWPSRHIHLRKFLLKLMPRHSAVQLLSTDPEAIARKAVRLPRLPITSHLSAGDYAVLETYWGPEVHRRFLMAGRFDLLPRHYTASTQAELQALLRHLRAPAAKALLLKMANHSDTSELVVRKLCRPSPTLRAFLRSAANTRPLNVEFLIPHLGSRPASGVLTAKALKTPSLFAATIEYWTDQPESKQKSKVISVLAETVATIKSRNAFSNLAGEILKLGPEAPRLLGKRVGAGRLELVLPSLTVSTVRPKSGHVVAQKLHAQAVMAGIRVDDPLTSWAAVLKTPSFADVVRGLQWPAPTDDSPPEQTWLAVLAATSNWRQLRDVMTTAGPSAFGEAASMVGPCLAPRSRARAFLELAAILPPASLTSLARAFSMAEFRADRGCKLDGCYKTYRLPKKTGGTRIITVPEFWLRELQRAVYERVLHPLGAHDAAHGFVRGRSIVSNAEPHVGRPIVVNCDIASCFPSVGWSLVWKALERDLQERFAPGTIAWITDLCCYGGALPIGAPTSPALLNRVLIATDSFLANQADRRQCRYTRYADDLTFSGDDRAVSLLRIAKSSLERIGLALDERKTNIYRGGRRQIVTGLVVNRRVSVPRRLRRRMRAAVHAVECGAVPTWHGRPTSVSSLRGRLAFTRSVNPEEASRLLKRLAQVDEG